MFYKGAEVVILVYDVTNSQSFTQLNFWYKEVMQQCSQVPIFCVMGNK